MNSIRFIFALHNHQPVGNFGHVFEQSYQESYLPFLDVFEGYRTLKLTLHTSGSLLEWLYDEHRDYIERIAELAGQNRIEIVGGPFFEPILAMLPSRDRIGQIEKYSAYLKKHFGTTVQGLWIPERVWEQSYVRDLADAGMHYTILDDSHLKYAGLKENALLRHYLTEDDGKTLNVFPGSEKLRYLIPFGSVEDTLNFFRETAEKNENAVLVHGDDGEKFGNWPQTYKHVYEDKWLHRFFDALSENSDWLITTTPSEVLSALPPKGKIYIPDGSYREMTEWVLEPQQQIELNQLRNSLEHDERLPVIKQFLHGGFWRNFKVRYPESDEMYCRMMSVSARLHKAAEEGWNTDDLEFAREDLYRSQCNCGYWHGAFGGIYLPHLRNAVYHGLIQADKHIDKMTDRTGSWVESQTADFNFDGKNEVRLSNDKLNLFLAPQQGGLMYELDIKSIAHNLLATLSRRPEAYHTQIAQHQQFDNGGSEGRKVVFKQEGLEQRLLYDKYPRKGLLDLFYGEDADFQSVKQGKAVQYGSFVQQPYNAVIRKKTGRIQVLMSGEAEVYNTVIKIDKAITLSEGSDMVEIGYRLSKLPKNYHFHFAAEFNFAGMPGGAENRYFHGNGGPFGQRFGDLSTNLDITGGTELGLYDDYLGLDVSLKVNRLTDFYAFPIETVSISEGGFELVHQSVAVQPHWRFVADESGVWETEMRLEIDTTSAIERDEKAHSLLRDAARMLVGEIE